jgi:hypothetical protein
MADTPGTQTEQTEPGPRAAGQEAAPQVPVSPPTVRRDAVPQVPVSPPTVKRRPA